MKRILIVFITTIILFMFIGTCNIANAQDKTEEVPIVEEQDTLKESMVYYAKIIIEYVAAIGGTVTGLLAIIYRIKKVLKKVEEGTQTVESAKNELEKEREELEKSKQNFIYATEKFSKSIKNQEELDKLSVSVDRIIESLKIIVSNDSKLVSSGVAKEINNVLSEVEQEEINYDEQKEIHSV